MSREGTFASLFLIHFADYVRNPRPTLNWVKLLH
jgi:hypothetical protein